MPGFKIGDLVRRPLLWLFVLGCATSLLAAGRVTPRLVADGMISFAFVPVCQIGALFAAWRRGPHPPIPFSLVVDGFFAGVAPWLWLTIAVGGVFAVVPPHRLGPWITPAIGGCALAALASAWIDFRFFRRVKHRSARDAVVDLALQRALGWTTILGYFLGVAIRPELPWLASKVGL